jgi:hypothetical protein
VKAVLGAYGIIEDLQVQVGHIGSLIHLSRVALATLTGSHLFLTDGC